MVGLWCMQTINQSSCRTIPCFVVDTGFLTFCRFRTYSAALMAAPPESYPLLYVCRVPSIVIAVGVLLCLVVYAILLLRSFDYRGFWLPCDSMFSKLTACGFISTSLLFGLPALVIRVLVKSPFGVGVPLSWRHVDTPNILSFGCRSDHWFWMYGQCNQFWRNHNFCLPMLQGLDVGYFHAVS